MNDFIVNKLRGVCGSKHSWRVSYHRQRKSEQIYCIFFKIF